MVLDLCDTLFCLFFFFKQKTAYELRISAGVQTCALPISPRAATTTSASAWSATCRTGPRPADARCPAGTPGRIAPCPRPRKACRRKRAAPARLQEDPSHRAAHPAADLADLGGGEVRLRAAQRREQALGAAAVPAHSRVKYVSGLK